MAGLFALGAMGAVSGKTQNGVSSPGGVTAAASAVGAPDSRAGRLPVVGDHYHAIFGISICGKGFRAIPPYEAPTGVHSHGDKQIHIHPYNASGAGRNATVGLFVSQAGGKLTKTSIQLPDGTRVANGDKCPNLEGRPGRVRWSLNGQEQSSDPSAYVPTPCQGRADAPGSGCDIIAVAFVPDGVPITPDVEIVPPAPDLPSGTER